MDKNKFTDAMKYLFRAKGKETNTKVMAVWYDALKDYSEEKTLIAIKKLALNSKEFINVGMVIELMGESDNHRIEKEWAECLASAKNGGMKEISARAAKALNSLGGMTWLRNSNPSEINFTKKSFVDAWKNTPEPDVSEIRCQGLLAPIYFVKNNVKQLEG